MHYKLKSSNNRHQADLGKLSPFLQKAAKILPSRPNRCGGRYALLRNAFVENGGVKEFSV